jgi:hypothetical protein
MGTHINAFHADVEDAKLGVVKAQGELEAAEARLKAHPDYEVLVEPLEPVAEKPVAKPKVVKKTAKKVEPLEPVAEKPVAKPKVVKKTAKK